MERRLTAILAADVVGYSRLMGADESGTLSALKAVRADLIEGTIARHRGRIVKLTGDGILVEFPSVVNAVACAAEVQRGVLKRNAEVPAPQRLEFRMGVNLGDVIVEGDDIYGDGVNLAVRLESIASPGGITISHSVRDHVGNRLDLVFEDIGEQRLKNIERPIRAYKVLMDKAVVSCANPTGVERPSIAVLPFTNMSGDPEQEYFSDGISEDIITDLSKISGLHVIARHSAFIYKDKLVKVQQIGQELGVAFVLEGSVRKVGGRVRVSAQLVSGKDGGHVWAERFDRDLTDIFAIQDEITRMIIEQLRVKLLPRETQLISQAPTDNIEAYTYYLRGRDFFYRYSRHYFGLARRMFARAVELDPNYARAYAGMADCDSWLYISYHSDISLDSILATTTKALELDPNLAEAHCARAAALAAAHRYDEANLEFERALALDPQSFQAHFLYARCAFMQGHVERATPLFERAAEIRPDDYQAPLLLVQIYKSLGRVEESQRAAHRAIPLAERELNLHPEDARPAHLGAGALIEIGEKERAREWIARALAIEPEDPITLYNVACCYTGLGENGDALDILERVVALGGRCKDWIQHDSTLAPLRSHPRFQKVVQALG